MGLRQIRYNSENVSCFLGRGYFATKFSGDCRDLPRLICTMFYLLISRFFAFDRPPDSMPQPIPLSDGMPFDSIPLFAEFLRNIRIPIMPKPSIGITNTPLPRPRD